MLNSISWKHRLNKAVFLSYLFFQLHFIRLANGADADTRSNTVSGNSTSGATKNHILMHETRLPNSMDDLRGRVLKVIAFKEPPYVNFANLTPEAEVAEGTSPGIVMEILREISTKLDIQFQFITPATYEWGGNTSNGTWTGAFGYLYRKEIDILAAAAIMNLERSLISDLTYPFVFTETAMLIRSPRQFTDNTWLIVTTPFNWRVWLLIGISIVASGLIMKALTISLQSAQEVQFSLLQSIWIYFSVFVQQGLPVQPNSWTCRTMLAFWWLASLTLVATFTGNLVALFAVDKTYLPFEDINGMVAKVQSGAYQVVMDGNSMSRTDMIKQSQTEVYNKLKAELFGPNGELRKVKYIKGLDNCVDYVKKNAGYVFFGPRDALEVKALIDCDVTVLQKGLLPVEFSIPLQKDSPFSTIFSDKVRELQERGFIAKWLKDYKVKTAASSQNRLKCDSAKDQSQSKDRLTLNQSQGAFWVLLIGVGVSVFGLGFERLFGLTRLLNRYLTRKTATSLTSQKINNGPLTFASHFSNGLTHISYGAPLSNPYGYQNGNVLSPLRRPNIVRFLHTGGYEERAI